MNILALGILVAGVLYLGEYRRGLITTELESLRIQATMLAAALGETVVAPESASGPQLLPQTVNTILRQMAVTAGARARLFAPDGSLTADSRALPGTGAPVQAKELPPPRILPDLDPATMLGYYDDAVEWLVDEKPLDPYEEKAEQTAADYSEVARALTGDYAARVRRDQDKSLVLSVAVPVQRYKQVLGALMLTKDSRDMDEALFMVRMRVVGAFTLAMGITMMLSVYLAGTIVRPIVRLAKASDLVRREQSRRHQIPDLSGRDDEIGDLANSLHEMTQALWNRLDAIERFAADVSHEIKNPLTSLRSAVETAARVQDPERREKLMAIIQEDVTRLDRLISDISDASRVDAELSREEKTMVDLGHMLAVLADTHNATRKDGEPTVEVSRSGELSAPGLEGRLVQVFRNLIANAVSFSPPGGVVRIKAQRVKGWVAVTVEDYGPGIPEGKLEAIFERFYTERPSEEKFGTHSGLGLSISRQIVEAHEGTLIAENRSGGGARFTARIPGR